MPSAGTLKHVLVLTIFLRTYVSSISDFNVWGEKGQGYYLEIEIGSPPQKLNVLLDTGSANLAVAASASLPNVEKYFQRNASRTFRTKGQSVSVTYIQGTWQGVLGTDIVRVQSVRVKRVRCDIALIQESEDFFTNGSKWQGIMGLGYPILAQPLGSSTSWLTSLPSPSAFSLQLGCSTAANHTEVFGYLELLKPPLPDSPFKATVVREWFYEVLITAIWINNKPIDVHCTEFNNDKSIVDSGTTGLRLPKKVFLEAVRMINDTVQNHGCNVSNTFWTQQGSVCMDVKPETIFPNVSFGLARDDGKFFKVVLSPLSYLRIDEESHNQLNCYQLALESSDTGSVLGLVFLEGLKVTFDQASRSVGFSTSTCGPPVLLQGPFSSEDDLLDCMYKETLISPLAAISITMGAFLSVAAVFLAYLACSRFCHRYLCPSKSQWPHRSRSRRELIPRSSDFDLTTAT